MGNRYNKIGLEGTWYQSGAKLLTLGILGLLTGIVDGYLLHWFISFI